VRQERVGLLVALLGASVGACVRNQPTAAEELRFRPPRGGESIVVEQEFHASPERNTIYIYRIKGTEKEQLFTVKPQTNTYFIASQGQDTYYSVDDEDPDNGLNDVWKVETEKGRIVNTGIKVGGLFTFSQDGRYMCYVYNDYGKEFDWPSGVTPTLWLFIPVLKVRDMNTGQTQTYDFSETFLAEGWGALTEIEPLADRFSVEFSIDGGTLGKGYMLLSDLKWYQTK